jgi:radical SAM superfamily enzyme YgiQ (UPF0313 family)
VKPEGRTGLGFALALIPLGLESVAASIADIVDEINILDMLTEKRHSFPYFIDLFNPDLVGISMSATEHESGLSIASIAKKRGIATVLGGYHPTAVPDDLLSHVSWVLGALHFLLRTEYEQRSPTLSFS